MFVLYIWYARRPRSRHMLGIKELLQKSGKNAAIQKCQFVKKRKLHILVNSRRGGLCLKRGVARATQFQLLVHEKV